MSGLRRVLFFGVVVAAGAIALYFYGGDGWLRNEIAGIFSGPTTQVKHDVTTPDTEAEPASLEPASGEAAGAPQPPAFDVVRVEDSGEMVVAGVAPPGWTVRIHTQQGTVGTTEAGIDGTWALLPEKPLPAGSHSLSLTALAPDGSRSVDGTARVAVSVSRGGAPAVVALSDSDKPTRVLQSGMTATDDTPEAKAPAQDSAAGTIAFSAVDYEDEQETGQLYMSGKAKSEARIALYLDNRFIGSTRADKTGVWEFSITDILDAESHVLRADHVDMEKGEVLSRAEVAFEPDGVATASANGKETRTAVGAAQATADAPRDEPGQTPLAGQASTSVATASDAADVDEADRVEPKEAIVVHRGDTLWHIAERHYGSGVRYTKIFRNNRDQIRSPHRIYPGQQFELPQ
ncbi:MAG: LysM peptidoglycan-binding domain-containing protein [Dichotomicrobium sp.]